VCLESKQSGGGRTPRQGAPGVQEQGPEGAGASVGCAGLPAAATTAAAGSSGLAAATGCAGTAAAVSVGGLAAATVAAVAASGRLPHFST
jgi:hypothetical protein